MLYTRLVLKRVPALTFSQLALIAFLLSAVMLLNIIIQDYYEKKTASIYLSFRVSILTLLCALAYQFLNIPVAVKTKFQIVYFIILLLIPIFSKFIEYVKDTTVRKNLRVLYWLFVSSAHACFFYYGFPGTFPNIYEAFSAVIGSYLLSLLISLGVVVGLLLFIAIIVAIVCNTRFGFLYDAFFMSLARYSGQTMSRASSNHFDQAANPARQGNDHVPGVRPQGSFNR